MAEDMPEFDIYALFIEFVDYNLTHNLVYTFSS